MEKESLTSITFNVEQHRSTVSLLTSQVWTLNDYLSSPYLLQILFACLVAVAAAAPQQFVSEFIQPPNRPIGILRDERQNTGDGNFSYDFETENGIAVNVVGTVGSLGQTNMQGGYR